MKHEKLRFRIGVSSSKLESAVENGREVLSIGIGIGSEVMEKIEGFGNRS